MSYYYQTLHNSNDTCGNYDLFNLQAEKLDQNDKIETYTPVNIEEIGVTLSIFKKNRSLGIDRIGIEILKFSWPDLKQDYLQMVNEAHNARSLTESKSNGIPSLIDKWKKRLKIKNWRLLKILGMNYKLLTKLQTIRIDKYFSRTIGADQRGFMKDCYIGSNILELHNLIDYISDKYCWSTEVH